jgi:MFS family permease
MSDLDGPNSRNEFAAGWRILLGSIIGIAVGVSSLYFYSLGIFIKPLGAEFGWTRGEASLGALVGTLAAALMSPVMGRVVDRFGSLKVAVASVALLALGFVAHAWLISGLVSFLLVTFVVSLLTAGTSPLPYTRLTVTSFHRHRGLALGIVLAGTGIGAILIPRFLAPFIETEGWRAGYLALAAAAALALPLIALLLGRAPDLAGANAPSFPILDIARTRAFSSLAIMFLLAAVAILGTVVQFVPMLSDAGLSSASAGGIASLIGMAAIAGRLVIGTLLDRLPARAVTAGLFIFSSAGLLMLAFGGVELAIPGALVLGVAVGAEIDLLSFLAARYFPATAFGQASGLLYGLFLVGGAIGPALSGFLYDRSGGYALSLTVASVLLAAAALIGALLPDPRTAVQDDRPDF